MGEWALQPNSAEDPPRFQRPTENRIPAGWNAIFRWEPAESDSNTLESEGDITRQKTAETQPIIARFPPIPDFGGKIPASWYTEESAGAPADSDSDTRKTTPDTTGSVFILMLLDALICSLFLA